MTATSSYAQYDVSYTNRVSYLTNEEYAAAPTAMDISNLVPGGGGPGQSVALTEVIARASSWIDQHTMGSYGSLAATTNTENARVWGSGVGGTGQLIIHPRYWPIMEVDAFSYAPQGYGSGNAASITPAGNIWIEPQQFIVTPQGVISWGINMPGGIVPGVPYFCSWSYTNGYPVSTLSASVAVGATSIAPVSVVGIYPNSTLTIYDEPYNEMVQVISSYIPGSATVPLVRGVQSQHPAGVMVTNLPPAIKQAAISMTSVLIKQRGSGALIVSDMGPVTRVDSGLPQGANADIALAKELLRPYRTQFVGY